ncbi:DUF2007 domain-containing protein [Parabacteroides merdae]|nr:DUF2007 domain-containing protein [Parabacteroides merdae]
MEDKIVEIARFYEPEAAQMIESLLKSEGVNCYLRNEYTSRIQYPVNVGGIRIELLESEVPRAKEIRKQTDTNFRMKTKRTSSSKPFPVGYATFRSSDICPSKNRSSFFLSL